MVKREIVDVVIVGAGAAGLMCAIEAGARGRSVVVLERNPSIGEKIRISGGGRCNFTNLHTTPDHFITANANFHKSALARYGPADFVQLVERHRIPYHEKKAGQLFCDGSAMEIVGMLRRECDAARVRLFTGCRIERITEGFFVSTQSQEFRCASLVIATGGLSIPKIGATDFGYRIASQFGLRRVAVRPALVPLQLDGELGATLAKLSGVSLRGAGVRCRDVEFQESVLFTHRGLSGPAILQISSYWEKGLPIVIDTGEQQPKRFLQAWREIYAGKESIENNLRHWALMPSETDGYEKAEVTAGGIDTTELSSKTMEARNVAGLYFIGEVVDVTGQLGGYNFQWAWSSGVAAGQSV